MSKKELDITNNIMSGIKNGQIKMKPKWYFVVGSILMILGLTAIFITTTFLVSLLAFSLRTHGPMGAIRFQQLISDFPVWAPILAVVGIVLGIIMLRKYDFSYKKNFPMIVVGVVVGIILAGILMDYLNINTMFARSGFGKAMYGKYGGGGYYQNINAGFGNHGQRK